MSHRLTLAVRRGFREQIGRFLERDVRSFALRFSQISLGHRFPRKQRAFGSEVVFRAR